MKKFFSILCALCVSVMSFAQSQTNYSGSSRFTDNQNKEEEIECLKKCAAQHDTIYIEVPTDNSNKFYFEKNSLNLTGDISELANSLKESGSTCVITGYASKEGSEKRNNVLAERRANVLKQALVKSGVANSKIKVVNGGSTGKFSKTSLEPNRVAVVEK